MITKPTVFVLGAGTSMPYGFPSGSHLVREICNVTTDDPLEYDSSLKLEETEIADLTKDVLLLKRKDIGQVLRNFFGRSQTEEFGRALHFSQRYSIDAFLERRPEYMDIGKWAIALFILRKEIKSHLFDAKFQNEGCYRYLIDRMDTKWDQFSENKVSFITFNYDRSLEEYLFTTIQKTYGKNETECAEMIGKLPIIHVHGSLGKLPWQDTNGIPYGANLEKYDERLGVANAAAGNSSKQIKVIPENQSTSEELDEAYRLLSEADRIYFLGFSYHSTNLKRLRIDELTKKEKERTRGDSRQSRMKGSGMGLELKEKESIKEWFIDIPDNSSDSLLFLRRYADLD
jgi:hypothetical protein